MASTVFGLRCSFQRRARYATDVPKGLSSFLAIYAPIFCTQRRHLLTQKHSAQHPPPIRHCPNPQVPILTIGPAPSLEPHLNSLVGPYPTQLSTLWFACCILAAPRLASAREVGAPAPIIVGRVAQLVERVISNSLRRRSAIDSSAYLTRSLVRFLTRPAALGAAEHLFLEVRTPREG